MMTASWLDAFRQEIEQAGLTPPATIIADGKLHRFASNGDRADDAGWYTYFPDETPAGVFGCWRKNFKQTWCSKADSTLTPAERERQQTQFDEARRQREQDERLRHADAAQRAQRFWDGAKPAPANHPYLIRKGIQPHGVRVDDKNRLIVPVIIDGSIVSLQFIDANGGKQFLPGGKVKGGTFIMGELSDADALLLGEGFATGASLHESASYPVVVAFSASSLTPGAEQLRRQFPTVTIVLCGDNDLNGTGQREAQKAAEAIGGLVVLPETPGQDFNDVHVQLGLDVVKVGIERALTQKETQTMTTATGDVREAPLKGARDLSTALVSYTDLLSLQIPERPCYLPWLPEGGNVMVYGPRGVGKTFFNLALAVSLATGKDLWKWNCPAPVGVLYIDGEMQLDELRQRTTALMGTPPVAPLEFLTGQLVYQRCDGKDLILTTDAMRQEVVKILDACPEIRVMILDNVSCLFSGLNEDSKQDWEPINAWLIRLRHRGLATVLVHHAGKGGQQRGTSGREDSLDTVIHLAKPTGADARDGCHFELEFTKHRSVTGDAVGPLDVRLHTVNGNLQWVWNLLEVSMLDRARQLVKEGVQGPTDLGEELGISKGYASKILKKLKEETS